MSVTDVNRRDELLAAAARHQASIAFLQMGDPALSRELTRLADEQAENVASHRRQVLVCRAPGVPHKARLPR